MEKKRKYNDSNIDNAVNSLIDCIGKIRKELNPERYQDLIDSLEDTVSTLNKTDDLMPFKAEIKSVIIDPVEKQLKKTKRGNLWFGWFGIGAATVALIIGFFSFQSTSKNILDLKGQLTEVNYQIQTSDIITGKTFKTLGSQLDTQTDLLKTDTLNNVTKIQKYILERELFYTETIVQVLKKNTKILYEVKTALEETSPYFSKSADRLLKWNGSLTTDKESTQSPLLFPKSDKLD